MSKHTPGPWEAIFSDDSIWVTPPNHNEPVICDLVARQSSQDETSKIYTEQFQEEDEANARLIAAAPELLEALQFCQSVIKSQGMWDRSEQLAYEKASSAIAKATGEKEKSA